MILHVILYYDIYVIRSLISIALLGNVKALNLEKLKLSLSPSPQWPQAALRLGGDGRQVS